MRTALLLVALTQLADLRTWTDEAGVTHVASVSQAPAGAAALTGGSYSVIDGDGRREAMPDGGTRAEDSRWWRRAFRAARSALAEAEAQERLAAAELAHGDGEVCVEATARASVAVAVVASAPAVALVASGQATSTVQVPAGVTTVALAHQDEHVRRCEARPAGPGLREALRLRQVQLHDAQRALRALEREAVAARVPIRDWY